MKIQENDSGFQAKNTIQKLVGIATIQKEFLLNKELNYSDPEEHLPTLFQTTLRVAAHSKKSEPSC